jgi:predicted lipoprotein with Yx(FWY)xxD motif
VALATAAPPTAVPPTAEPPTTAPTAAATTAPTVAPTAEAAEAKAVTVQVTQNDALGRFLAEGDGRTLYLFMKDTKDTSNCYDKCAQSWPALLPAGQPTLMDGVNAALIGTTQRKDGASQLTYNGWPLYYFAKDQAPGDTSGQSVGDVWWVVSAEGNAIRPAALQLAENAKLGKLLADGTGRTLYAFTKDVKDTSNCYDKCEQAWPPLLALGQPVLGEGVDSTLIATTQRKDGTLQVTYKGMPLYYFAADNAPGDTNGQGVGKVWFAVSADGSLIQ